MLIKIPPQSRFTTQICASLHHHADILCNISIVFKYMRTYVALIIFVVPTHKPNTQCSLLHRFIFHHYPPYWFLLNHSTLLLSNPNKYFYLTRFCMHLYSILVYFAVILSYTKPLCCAFPLSYIFILIIHFNNPQNNTSSYTASLPWRYDCYYLPIGSLRVFK